MGKEILSLGLAPSAIDPNLLPQRDTGALENRIADAGALLREAGFEVVPCLIGTDPEDAEAKVRECLAAHPIKVVMIGGGLRLWPEQTPLFERLVNLIIQEVPGVTLCFNTSPETTVDALRRWVS
ncbi:hypothetical protein D5S17_03645 [Pseudonocardiaceae bacterium YIM PH 21723]|nr:hypothetical protein D5S17_03645 [Pseudonocardiaceae bacterium YIM PH 21723]